MIRSLPSFNLVQETLTNLLVLGYSNCRPTNSQWLNIRNTHFLFMSHTKISPWQVAGSSPDSHSGARTRPSADPVSHRFVSSWKLLRRLEGCWESF